MAVTVHFQSTGMVPGDGRPVRMVGGSMTIGRSPDNDLVLPDPEKSVSKRHCAIETSHGVVTAVDMSTNGTFLNYAKVPVGEVPAPLNNGDVLTIGPYELLVEITEDIAAGTAGGPSAMQAAAYPGTEDILGGADTSDDFLDELLGDGAAPTGPSSVQRRDDADEDDLLPPLGDDADDLLGPAPATDPHAGARMGDHSAAAQDHFRPSAVSLDIIPDDWNPDDLLGDAPLVPPDPLQAGDAPGALSPEDPFAADPSHTVPPTAAPRADTALARDAAARAFLKTAGAERLNIPDEDLVPTLARMGHVMRILVKGLREVLMTRTSIKSEFRIQQTVIGAGGNNPLKFSVSPEQAIEAMVRPPETGYLDPVDAAEQALQDIKAHEIAMMTGMEAALKDVLRQLSPAELEKKMQTGGGLGGLLKGRKARYWEVYEQMYAEIADRAENDFHEMFSREFARAYQAQLERLK
jgi:type VI secretion system protein ImpI/type VI secretion system protein